MDLLRSSVTIFCDQLKDVRYVVPNLLILLQGPVPASSLKPVKLNRWPQGAILSKAGHFVAVNISTFNGDFPLDKAALISRYRQVIEVIETIDTPFSETARVEVLTCVREMCKNLVRLWRMRQR